MKKGMIMLSVLLLLISYSALAGLKIEVSPTKASFSEGDILSFDYTISSDAQQEVIFIPQIRCSGNMPSSFIEWKTVDVGPANPFKEKYYGAKIDESVDSQECIARIIIRSPDKKTYERRFQVAAKPAIDVVLNTCRDPECKTTNATFYKDSIVYLNVTSKTSPRITASVVFPDQTSQAVTVPGNFTATQPGKYIIEISASKEGYKKYFSRAQIAVVEAPYTISYAEFSGKAGQPVARPTYEVKATETRAQGIGRTLGCSLIIPQ